MTRAVVAFGANLGDRAATISSALDQLNAVDGVTVTAVSPLSETVAVRESGPDNSHPDYLNGVALVDSTISAHALLAALHDIEHRHGRVRAERWGDRTLDLDLVTFGDLVEDGNLVVPHPRAHERRFVLEPWLALDPAASIPGKGTVRDLLEGLSE